MKAPFAFVLLLAFVFASCNGEADGYKKYSLNITETEDVKVIAVGDGFANILPVEGKEYIIIQDMDTARYEMVLLGEEGDSLGAGDGVYHSSAQLWGDSKNVYVVKDGSLHHFIIIQDMDTARMETTQYVYPFDPAAIIDDLEGGGFRVRNIVVDDGSVNQFDSSEADPEGKIRR